MKIQSIISAEFAKYEAQFAQLDGRDDDVIAKDPKDVRNFIAIFGRAIAYNYCAALAQSLVNATDGTLNDFIDATQFETPAEVDIAAILAPLSVYDDKIVSATADMGGAIHYVKLQSGLQLRIVKRRGDSNQYIIQGDAPYFYRTLRTLADAVVYNAH